MKMKTVTIVSLFSACFLAVSVAPGDVNIARVNKLAYLGNLKTLNECLQEASDLEWSQLCCREHQTAIHRALQGRMDSVNRHVFSGQHEDVIIRLSRLAGYNTSHGCPLYYAVHYRNMEAIRLLLNLSTHTAALHCLTGHDSSGLTALHAACTSKASGFARLYATALHRNQLSQPVLQNVGLSNIAFTASLRLSPLRITMSALQESLGNGDVEMILNHFRATADLDLNAVVDSKNSTVLHHAARAGRASLVNLLIRFGADATQRNSYGMTPLHLACTAGFPDTILELLQGLDTGGKLKIVGMVDNFGRSALDILQRVTGMDSVAATVLRSLIGSLTGWPPVSLVCPTRSNMCPYHSTKPLKMLKDDSHLTQERGGGWFRNSVESTHESKVVTSCNIDRRNATLTGEEFIRDYFSIQKPVVLMGFSQDWPSSEKWRKMQFLKHYGHLEVQLTSIPYSYLYGLENDTRPSTIKDFVSTFASEPENAVDSTQHPNGTHSGHSYLFDAQLLHRHPGLASDVRTPKVFENMPVRMKQFILGDRGSGSPGHFHGSAYNALIFGQKKWFLWRPYESFFSFQPMSAWLNSPQASDLISRSIQFVQNSGEIVFVPENWGHAVINMQPSIAVAVELQ